MKIVITDVSVFFDLFYVQVLPEFFALDLSIHTTNFVYNEIIKEEQIEEFSLFERTKKLHIIKITAEEEAEIRALELARSNKSFPDRTVLWKARQLQCPLLTCDNKLRKEAEAQGILVHGSIWVVLQLVEGNILTKEAGAKVLEKMKQVNTRLPHDEIDKLIKNFK
jgi:predicted nucleic acid-binding protein